MDMKKLIQQMTDLENQGKKPLNESRRIAECPPTQAVSSPMAEQVPEGIPVSVNVNMNASGKEHVNDLLDMMKAAGLDNAKQMKPDMMPMRQDMERLRGIVDDPEIPGMDDVPGDQDVNNGAFLAPMAGAALGTMAANKITGEEEIKEYDTDPDQELSDRFESMEYLLDKIDPKWSSKKYSEKEAYKLGKAVEQLPDNQDNLFNAPEITDYDVVDLLDKRRQIKDDLDEYDNEPEEEYRDHHYMTKDLSGGINRRKKSYSDAEDGDNAMAVNEKEADPEVIAKVQELSKINDIDVLKKEVYDLVKNTKMNKAKKMQLMRNAENSRTVKNLIGLLWNTFVLGAEGKHAPGSSWSKRFENTEDEMRESIKDQLYAALSEKKAKPDYIDLDKDGDKKEPMKKAAKDAKKKKTNEGMPSSVIKYKQKLANMPDDELAQKLSGKSDDELRMMARRHGYGKDTDHYINRTKKTNEAAPSSRLAKRISQAYSAMADMGDSGLDYLDDHAPLYDKLMNKHNNDLDRIIAKEKPPVLLKLAKELESVVDSAGFEMESTEEADINRLAKRIR